MQPPVQGLLTLEELSECLAPIPRADIALRNTPLHPLPRLSARLGGPPIYAKRDDLTDLALGGNKARIMEYVMPDVVARGADTVIVTAFTQSNLCRQTAAACRKLGLQPLLVLKGKPGSRPAGNLILDVLLGAELHFIDTENNQLTRRYILQLMDRLRAAGRKPYFVDSHGPTAVFSAFAYLGCYIEIMQQARALGSEPGAIVVASASGGTQSGLVLGAALNSPGTRVIGVNPMGWSADWVRERTLQVVRAAEARLGVRTGLLLDDITVLGDYVGPGYGVPTPLGEEAQRLFAQDETLMLDPSYTSKAAGAMIDLIRKGELPRDKPVVFVHSGGAPILFAHGPAFDETRVHVVDPNSVPDQ